MDYMSSAPETYCGRCSQYTILLLGGGYSTICKSFATYFKVLACINVK